MVYGEVLIVGVRGRDVIEIIGEELGRVHCSGVCSRDGNQVILLKRTEEYVVLYVYCSLSY